MASRRSLLLAAPLLALPWTARAQRWPAGPVRIVSPFTPGGGSSWPGRLPRQATHSGQTGKPGGTPMSARPPGYTLPLRRLLELGAAGHTLPSVELLAQPGELGTHLVKLQLPQYQGQDNLPHFQASYVTGSSVGPCSLGEDNGELLCKLATCRKSKRYRRESTTMPQAGKLLKCQVPGILENRQRRERHSRAWSETQRLEHQSHQIARLVNCTETVTQ